MLPVTAVGRTAVAVGGLADCGIVIGMARSRVWIGVLGVLLGGIVALNVWGLSLSAGSSATAAKIDALERDNSVLRGRAASKLSTNKIEAAAASLGLAVPAPDAVHYLTAGDGDAARATKRLADGLITAVAPVAEVTLTDPAVAALAPAPTADPAAALDPATVAPVEPVVDPAVAEAAVAEPTITAPAAADPATVAPGTESASGGIPVP